MDLSAETFNAQMDGEKLMVGSRDFDDGSMMVGVGTDDIDVQDPDFMEMMIGKYFLLHHMKVLRL